MKVLAGATVIKDCCNCKHFRNPSPMPPCSDCLERIYDKKGESIQKVMARNWADKSTKQHKLSTSLPALLS